MKRKKKEIEDEYLEELEYNVKLIGNDNEALHIYCDETILGLLKELGYKKIVKEYNKIKNKNRFWY